MRLADRESALSARTIARRLSSVSGLYAYLIARGDTPVQASPVPRGLSTRRQGGPKRSRTVPLVRVPRTLPKVLAPGEVDRLLGALRTDRDKASSAPHVPGQVPTFRDAGGRCGVWCPDRGICDHDGRAISRLSLSWFLTWLGWPSSACPRQVSLEEGLRRTIAWFATRSGDLQPGQEVSRRSA